MRKRRVAHGGHHAENNNFPQLKALHKHLVMQ